MATTPLTNIFFPSDVLDITGKGYLSCAIAALAASGGAAAKKTITIGNDYPAINRSVPNPVLAILAAQTGATLAANGVESWNITGQCSTTPDSAGEFQITGDRTIDVWQQTNETMTALIIYVAKGTGQKR